MGVYVDFELEFTYPSLFLQFEAHLAVILGSEGYKLPKTGPKISF